MDKNQRFGEKVDLGPYIGQWVGIANEQIVAHGKDFEKVFKETKRKFPKEEPFFAMIPEENWFL
tara:strand:- start:1325 stop:1516 length:192 start_codon:yes stop_codon:yes gene_type:complete